MVDQSELRRLLAAAKINREIALIAAIERQTAAIIDLTKAIDMAQPGSHIRLSYQQGPTVYVDPRAAAATERKGA